MKRKTLLFFGRPRLKVDGEHVEIRSRKGAALLANLAVTDRPASRDVLALLLWSEATSGADGTVRFWDAVKWVALSEPLPAHDGRVHLLFSPDGQVLISFGEDGLLQRWLPAMREKLGAPLRGHQPGVPLEPIFDPSGQTPISAMIVETAGGNRPQIIEWQLNKPEALRLVGHSADVLSVAFANEAELITSVAGDGEIHNWSPDGQFLSVAAEVDWTGDWWGISLDPSGRLLVRGKAEGPIVAYDAQTGEPLRTLDEPPLPIARFDFTAGGQLLTGAGCEDGTLTPQHCDVGQTWVWNPTTGEVVATFSTPELVHTRVITSLEFVADGQRLLTTSVDDTVVLFDASQLLGSATEASSSPVELACSRANRNLTPAEWQRHFGEEPYRATCPEQPRAD